MQVGAHRVLLRCGARESCCLSVRRQPPHGFHNHHQHRHSLYIHPVSPYSCLAAARRRQDGGHPGLPAHDWPRQAEAARRSQDAGQRQGTHAARAGAWCVPCPILSRSVAWRGVLCILHVMKRMVVERAGMDGFPGSRIPNDTCLSMLRAHTCAMLTRTSSCSLTRRRGRPVLQEQGGRLLQAADLGGHVHLRAELRGWVPRQLPAPLQLHVHWALGSHCSEC